MPKGFEDVNARTKILTIYMSIKLNMSNVRRVKSSFQQGSNTSVPMMKDLLKYIAVGAINPNIKNGLGDTPLHLACLKKMTNAVKLLVAVGANLNIQRKNGLTTPLHIACDTRFTKGIAILLNAGANPNIGNVYGQTPLFIACLNNTTKGVKLLLAKGANPNIPSMGGILPLHVACSQHMTKAVKLLLFNGANVNAQTEDNETPLFKACYHNFPKGVKLLLAKGAKPNVSDRDGFTPLHQAVGNKMTESVKLLLKAGADPNFLSVFGITPLDFACDQRKPASMIIKYLILYGARETTRCTKAQTQNHIRALNKHVVERQSKHMNNKQLQNAYKKHGKPANRNLKNVPKDWYKILTYNK